MKILVDEIPEKVTDCCFTSHETVFGKPVLVCRLSNNDCMLCNHQPCDRLISFSDYMSKPVVCIDGMDMIGI